jgi:hypothetical protein
MLTPGSRHEPAAILLSLDPALPPNMTTRTRKRTPPIPTPAEEAAAYIRGLEHRRQVAAVGTVPLPAGVTHVVEVTPAGAKRIERKRFR